MKHLKIGNTVITGSVSRPQSWTWKETTESRTCAYHLFSVTVRQYEGCDRKSLRVCVGPFTLSFGRTEK